MAALPGNHCIWGWVGPWAGLDGCGKSRPYRDSIPDRPARSESLHRVSYPNSQGKTYALILPSITQVITGKKLQVSAYQHHDIMILHTHQNKMNKHKQNEEILS